MELLLQLLSVLLALLSRFMEVFTAHRPPGPSFTPWTCNHHRRTLAASGRAAVPAAEREGGRTGAVISREGR